MDIVFANQSLYYIPKTELKQNILEFYECLNQSGILFATMMSEKNYYFSHSEKENENGLCRVSIQGRLNETTYIHFAKSIDELQELLKPYFWGIMILLIFIILKARLIILFTLVQKDKNFLPLLKAK